MGGGLASPEATPSGVALLRPSHAIVAGTVQHGAVGGTGGGPLMPIAPPLGICSSLLGQDRASPVPSPAQALHAQSAPCIGSCTPPPATVRAGAAPAAKASGAVPG